jgi:tRNA (guanosine-2'-O-)-methyltransferase
MSVSERRAQRLREVLAHRQPDLTVVMENIHDPHNVSAMLRSCDAIGVHRVELLYTAEKFPRIGRKSSSSANKWIERRKHASVESCYATLRREGYAIHATQIGNAVRSLYEIDLTRKVALVFGNEHRGVSPDVANQADVLFHIPMVGMIRSLNVSVACAVTLYEAFRQRLAAGKYGHPALSESELESLFNDWVRR